MSTSTSTSKSMSTRMSGVLGGNDKIRMTKLEAMTNAPMTNNYDRAYSTFACHAVAERRRVLRNSFVIRHSCFVISCAILMALQTSFVAMAETQSPSSPRDESVSPRRPDLVGRWNIEISFADGGQRSLRFEAQGEGKGTLELLDPRAKAWGAPTSWEAKWTLGKENDVTFSGSVEFMLGNVGRDAGTLEFRGKFEAADSITGEVEFSPLVGERPSKRGTFKATRSN